jgi:hypothetical protein
LPGAGVVAFGFPKEFGTGVIPVSAVLASEGVDPFYPNCIMSYFKFLSSSA